MKLKFTKIECHHVLRLSSKIAQVKTKDEAINKVLKELINKFNLIFVEGQEEVEVSLQRRHLRGIEMLVVISRDTLRDKVIPEYKRRGGFDEQMARAATMLTEYDGLLAKIEGAL